MSQGNGSIRDTLLRAVKEPARRDVTSLLPGLEGQEGQVFVRELTGRQRHEWTVENGKGGKEGFNPVDSNARLVILSVVHADGSPVFKPEDREALATGGAALVTKLADVAANVSGLYWREEDGLKNARSTSPSSAPPAGAG